jgi:hypothetical protein
MLDGHRVANLMRILCTCAADDPRRISVALVRALSSERQIEPSKNWRIEVTVFNIMAKNRRRGDISRSASISACVRRTRLFSLQGRIDDCP